jgi:DNA-binding CsgD family transcriptional regulator
MSPPGLKEKVAFLRNSNAHNLPLIYMIKDKNSRFQFITDIAAQHTGAQSANELIGKTSADLQCDAADFAEDFMQYEKLSIYQHSETLLLSLIPSAQGATISLICNKPIINDKGVVEGIETWAQILPSTTSLDTLVQGYQQASLPTRLNETSTPKLLTLREQTCVYYLTKGFTFAEIAKHLYLSPRTVEKHIANIKIKLGVRTRAELIFRVCELGYLQINSLDPNMKPGKLQLLNVKPCEPMAEIISK